jgi:hypothetical protein
MSGQLPITHGGQELGELRLRPFTLGTMEICRQLGLTMFFDGVTPQDEVERVRQVAAYLFIQSEPLDKVLRAVDDEDFEKKHLRVFKFRLTPAVLDAAIEMIAKNLGAVGDMVVEVEPRPLPSGATPEDPPPN